MSSRTRPQPENRVAWYYFISDLPPDWEITAFSTSEIEGRFEFGTREGFKGRISWQKCLREPDHTRMMTEFHLRYLRDNNPEGLETFKDLSLRQTGEFKVGIAAEGEPCQAQTFIPEEEVLLRWTFPEYSSAQYNSVWKGILNGFRRNLDEWREWGFFGIHCRLPRDFELNIASAMPANIAITLESSRPYRVSCHRWGLPDLVLEGTNLKGFYRKFLQNSRCKTDTFTEKKLFGCSGGMYTYKQPGMRGMDKLYGPMWNGRGFIWLNEEEQRMYACELIGPKKVTPLELEDVFLYQ